MSREYPCVYYDNEKCKKFSEDGITSYCVLGPCSHETPSNADRIRAMTDEELAELFHAISDEGKSCTTICDNYDRCKRNNAWEPICKNHYLEWLRQPCGGADHE